MLTIRTRYPDPAVRVLDPAFEKYRNPLAAVECIASGGRWLEGPVWIGDARHLFWSDIPNDRIMRWNEQTGVTDVYRHGSNNANGLTRDRQGRLIACEHGARRVTRTEYDGTITVLADRFDSKRLNSPNDVVVHSDGSVWFTDPSFGIENNYLGAVADRELPPCVYRLDPSGRLDIVIDDLAGPNGLAFSPDEKTLYVVDSKAQPRVILAYDVTDGKLRNRRVLIDAETGTPDGFRVDTDGNLWCGWGMGREDLDGVRVFRPDGTPIGHIALPERCANLCFGGIRRNRLFMAATTSVYSLYVNTQGVAGG